jgi:hypothetical protein
LSDTKEYKPAAVVTVEAEIPVAWLFAVTLAPGTIAPEGSVTKPLMPPLPAWENAAVPASRIRIQVRRIICTVAAAAFPNLMNGLSIKCWY